MKITDAKGKTIKINTDEEGIYEVHHLGPGNYSLEAEVDSANLRLSLGSEGQTVIEEQGGCVDGSLGYSSKSQNAQP